MKNQKYYFDLDAVKIPYSQYTLERIKKFIQNREHFDPKRHKHGDKAGQSPFEVLENTVKSALSFNYRVRLAKQERDKDYMVNASKEEISNYSEKPGVIKSKKDLDKTKKVDGWIGYERLISKYFPKNSSCSKSRARLDNLSLLEKLDLASLKKNPGDVWFLPTANFKGAHFAVFPEHLPELCIKAGCPKNGIVLDPFCGSGTTLLVAKKLGRNYIGIDINPSYVEMSRKRLNDLKSQV